MNKLNEVLMKKLNEIIIILSSIILMECGNPGVNLSDAAYEPKITVEAYLYGGETVNNIRLTRNFALGAPINPDQFYLTPNNNKVTITINGINLNYDQRANTYYNSQLTVDFNKAYTLEVFAVIDGKSLHTTSVTTTPQKGFSVFNKNLGRFKYNSDSITVKFNPSPGTDFYVFSIVADTSNTSNFIYNNLFRHNIDSSEVADNIARYKYQEGIMNNLNSFSGTVYSFTLNERDTWFYGSYTLVAYAGDQNFKDYFLTAPNVQEFDGNFHEPISIFNGDGIGVFASAIRNTIKFSIVK
jgi:hypothetical protein